MKKTEHHSATGEVLSGCSVRAAIQREVAEARASTPAERLLAGEEFNITRLARQLISDADRQKSESSRRHILLIAHLIVLQDKEIARLRGLAEDAQSAWQTIGAICAQSGGEFRIRAATLVDLDIRGSVEFSTDEATRDRIVRLVAARP